MNDFQQRLQIELPTPSKMFTPWMTTFLILEIIGFALVHHAPEFTAQYLAVSRTTLFGGQFWQLITHSILVGCWWNFMVDVLILLFFGSAVEREMKTGPYFFMWLVVMLSCGILWVLVNLIFGRNDFGLGAGAFAFAQMAAFGMVFREKKFFTFFSTLKAQYLAWIFIGFGILLGIQYPIGWVWVAGAGVAYVYLKLRRKFFEYRLQGGGDAGGRSRAQGFVDLD